MLSQREKGLVATLGIIIILCGLYTLTSGREMTLTVDSSTLLGFVGLLVIFLILYHMLHRHDVIAHTPMFKKTTPGSFEPIGQDFEPVELAAPVAVMTPPAKVVKPKSATKRRTKSTKSSTKKR